MSLELQKAKSIVQQFDERRERKKKEKRENEGKASYSDQLDIRWKHKFKRRKRFYEVRYVINFKFVKFLKYEKTKMKMKKKKYEVVIVVQFNERMNE